MGQLTKIIDYFFHHEFSQKMVERIHDRLAMSGDEDERDQSAQKIWDELDEMTFSNEESLKAYAKLEKRMQPSVSSSFSIGRWTRIAALWVIPLLSVSASLYFITKAQQMEQAMEKISYVEHYVTSGKRELVVLPDSSKVWLNSNTLLIYPSTFYGNKREVYLSGQGYFDVRPDKQLPFTVKTNAIDIRVLGTKFDLSAYPDAEKISATLETGSINVSIKNKEQSYTLLPNERLVYSIDTNDVSLTKVKVENYISWKNGGLLFKDDSFDTVIRTLERVYNVSVHLKTSAYSTNSLTIHFKQNETLENVLLLIKEVIPELAYRIHEKDVFIE